MLYRRSFYRSRPSPPSTKRYIASTMGLLAQDLYFIYDVSDGHLFYLQKQDFGGLAALCDKRWPDLLPSQFDIRPISQAPITMSRSIKWNITFYGTSFTAAPQSICSNVECWCMDIVRPHIDSFSHPVRRTQIINNKSANWMRSAQSNDDDERQTNGALAECEFMNRNIFSIHRCRVSV